MFKTVSEVGILMHAVLIKLLVKIIGISIRIFMLVSAKLQGINDGKVSYTESIRSSLNGVSLYI